MIAIPDEDSQQNFVLALVLALIALVVLFVLCVALYAHGQRRGLAPGTMVAVVTETVAVVIPEGAGIRVQGGTVNFYFASGSDDLAPGAAQALADVIQGVEAGRKALVSGFHDSTGDGGLNAQLARKRAERVRDVLVGLGVPAGRIELRKPAVTTGSGSDAEARRVEVRLVD